MICPAKTKCGDPSEKHLHPANHRHYFPDGTVRENEVTANAAVEALFKMQSKIDAQDDLDNEDEHEDRGKGSMDIGCELAATVSVAEEIPDDSEDGAEALDRNMPAGASDP